MAPHRTFRPFLVAILAFGAVAGFAAPASANHPDLSGQVACLAGEQVVTWTIENSETVSGENRTMSVDEVSVSSGSLVGIESGTVLPPRPLAGSTLTATTVLPGSQTGRVKLFVRADWDRGGMQDVTRTATVELPGGCEPAPDPAARIALDCSVGAVITFSNNGGGTVTYTVARDGVDTGTVRVGSGAGTARTFAMSEDDTDTFVVSASGMDPVSASLTFDCQQPPATTTTTTTPIRTTPAPVVLGEQVVQRSLPQLPRTGSGLGLLAWAGSGLVAAGLPLARLRRRTR